MFYEIYLTKEELLYILKLLKQSNEVLYINIKEQILKVGI